MLSSILWQNMLDYSPAQIEAYTEEVEQAIKKRNMEIINQQLKNN